MLYWPLGCEAEPAPAASVPEWGYESRPVNDTCLAHAPPASSAAVTLTRAFSSVEFVKPIAMLPVPGDPGFFWVAEKSGAIYRIDAGGVKSTVVDLADRVDSGDYETGLLGMALHPSEPWIFLNYTTSLNGSLQSRISRFDWTPTAIDADSEIILLELDQPAKNHNGGHLAFGPDGYLYAGFGDGGGAGDPKDRAQNLGDLLGKMLRIDVDTAPYEIPADNPFLSVDGAMPEIWAYGLRNPWRYTFDAAGRLWAGDVGQGAWEEIDILEAGGNYGWDVMEGTHCYNADSCDTAGLILPVAEYAHDGGASVVGGFVYRGSAIPELRGAYLFADTITSQLWRLDPDAAGGYVSSVLADAMSLYPTSFAEDEAGELYLLDYGGGVWRIDPATPSTDTFPTLLSETGCDDTDQLVFYDVISPLWSDAAEKERWLAIPDGEGIEVADDGEWTLPIGSVVRKDFLLDGERIETRLLERHGDGEWGGYTFRWEGGDAIRLTGPETVDGWEFPTGECLACHTEASGRLLGVETEQLDRVVTYGNGAEADQLDQLVRIGLIEDVPGPPALGADARGYLYANCAHCHQPAGAASMDFGWDTPLAAMGVCDVAPAQGDLGLADARIVAPGDPARSVLLARMQALDWSRMPPVASHVVDGDGAALVEAWIAGLGGCE